MTDNADAIRRIAERAAANRERWRGYARTPAEHLLIATEELGEVARSMQGGNGQYVWPPRYCSETCEELADLGAVVLAMLTEAESSCS